MLQEWLACVTNAHSTVLSELNVALSTFIPALPLKEHMHLKVASAWLVQNAHFMHTHYRFIHECMHA